jgi:hypothetical protein
MHETLDIVHRRLVLASAGSASLAAIKGLCTLVKKGGWIQLIESEYEADDAGPALPAPRCKISTI